MKHFISDKKYFAINDSIPFKIFSKVIDFQLKNPQINLTKILIDNRIVRIGDKIDVINFIITDGINNYTYHKKECWKEVKLNVFSRF